MAEPFDGQAKDTPMVPITPVALDKISQDHDVFMAGCGLPSAWRGAARWCVLQTGFGSGADFLRTWQAWCDDPHRPQLLHYVATEPTPVDADHVRSHAGSDPRWKVLAEALAQAWWGLEPGTHRITLNGGRVLLTLLVGDGVLPLRGLGRFADSVYLGKSRTESGGDKWDADALRTVARCCKRDARLSTVDAAPSLGHVLESAGFMVTEVHDGSVMRLQARLVHLPARHVELPALLPSRCVVIGAGLAGAAVARGLALRGWQVTVVDAGDGPATGASGVPAGLFAPHVSADDAVLSRLTRAGVRALLNVLPGLLRRGVDWDLSGVRQRQDDGTSIRHDIAGWLQPARLVSALLATPGITVEYRRRISAVAEFGDALVVVAAGFETVRLLKPGFPIQPVAGQVAFGPLTGKPATAEPVNGHGHFLPNVPTGSGGIWLTGASFERDIPDRDIPDDVRARHHAGNLQRLGELLPELSAQWPAMFVSAAQWRGVRATSPDRLPIVGPWPPTGDTNLWLCTALGARGMTLALLCADLLLARLHGEVLPIPPRLASAVFTERIARRVGL